MLKLKPLTITAFITLGCASAAGPLAHGKEILTNGALFMDAPEWLTATRIEKTIARIQSVLEWDIRRAKVFWYMDSASFAKVNKYGPGILALTLKNQNEIHLGPKVNKDNFDKVFTHELVHIIAYQKYKEAIPPWLEEGLATYLAKEEKVDYTWLVKQQLPTHVTELAHPLSGSSDTIRLRYIASQALTEMLAKKCDLSNLLRLSVGRKMDDYLKTYCEIPDLDIAFVKWIQSKAKAQ